VDALAAGALKGAAEPNDGARCDNFPYFARAGNCRATVQPRRNHSPRTVGAQGSIEELRAGIAGEEGSKTTLEQIFLSIVGQSGPERAQIEELSWLT